MKREMKIGLLAAVLLILSAIDFVLYTKGLLNYLIIIATFTVIDLLVLVKTAVSTRSAESTYNSKLKQILKTYDAILVKSNNLPKLSNKNIIIVNSIEDLVDAQMEIRKPIYYQQQVESCAFVLLDNEEACVYITKLNDSVICPLEITLNEIEINQRKKERNEEIPEEILKDIERTTIVRLKDDNYIKVSPLKKNKSKKEEQKQEVQQEEKIEEQKQESQAQEAQQEAKVEEQQVEIQEQKQEAKQAKKEKYKAKKNNRQEQIQKQQEEQVEVQEQQEQEESQSVESVQQIVQNVVQEITEPNPEKDSIVEEIVENSSDIEENVNENVDVEIENPIDEIEEPKESNNNKEIEILSL